MTRRIRVVILGAAGRDFHDFNVVFRKDARFQVAAFTATQIPGIDERTYPASLAGPLYPSGIPIYPEAELERLIEREGIDEVVFSYSDVTHETVMHLASRAQAAGAGFRLLAPRATMLKAQRPVLSVCAVRTGVGKSPVTRYIAGLLRDAGLRVVIVRHPMPYGELAAQAVQRFAAVADFARAQCTIEEMEEYEPHLRAGHVVYAGVDYELILRAAEAEADVILWDGGNNDLPFFESDCEVVLVDPHRAGDEERYFPGESNLRRANVIVASKIASAPAGGLERVRSSAARLNPRAVFVEGDSRTEVDTPALLRGARVLVVEDGPTTTHGGMAYGAGVIAAREHGATPIDPRPWAVGSLHATFEHFPHLTQALPAMGYGAAQVRELEATIAGADCDAVVVATPVDLRRLMDIRQPVVRVAYAFADRGEPTLRSALTPLISRLGGR